jgi:hypothetical protein
MADASVTLNAGSGGASLATYTDSGTVDHQRVVLEMQSSTNDPVHVNASNPLPTSAVQSGAWNITNISGTVTLPTGAATAAKQPALGTAGSASADVITVQGVASMTALKVDGSAVTQPVSGTFWQATQPVSAASLPLPSGASTAAKQPALGTAGSASTDVLTIQGIASMTKLLVTPDSVALPAHQSTNVDQWAGTAVDVNSGNKSAGTLRVTIATDQVALTNALKVDPSAVTSPVSIAATVSTAVVPGSAPGSTTSRVKSGASTNATNLKNAAGIVLGYALYNNTAAAKFFKFYNKASSPTVGTDTPFFTVVIPASGGANVSFGDAGGLVMGTGISYAITGAVGDSDTTSTAADDVHGCVLWK